MTNDDASGEFEEFEVIPAVDIQDGEVVQLVQGKRGRRPTAIPSRQPSGGSTPAQGRCTSSTSTARSRASGRMRTLSTP